MRNLENAVLARLKPDFHRERLAPGRHPVNFKAHFHGHVSVEPAQKVTPTAELSVYGVLVTALLEQGVDQARVLTVIERHARQALAQKKTFNQQLSAQAQTLIEDIRQRFAEKLPKVKRAGAIKLEIAIERI